MRPARRRPFDDALTTRRSSLDQLQDEQHQTRTDDGIEDLAENAAEHHDADARQQPSAHHCSNDANDDVSDESEAAAFHDLASQPTGNGANHEPNDQDFNSHVFSPREQNSALPSPAGSGLRGALPTRCEHDSRYADLPLTAMLQPLGIATTALPARRRSRPDVDTVPLARFVRALRSV
jgi:hypothetical protein